MLEQLLKEIQSGGTLETNALAVRLGASPQIIQAMLEHLQRQGWIDAYGSCADGCGGCSLRNSCTQPQKGGLHLWQSK